MLLMQPRQSMDPEITLRWCRKKIKTIWQLLCIYIETYTWAHLWHVGTAHPFLVKCPGWMREHIFPALWRWFLVSWQIFFGKAFLLGIQEYIIFCFKNCRVRQLEQLAAGWGEDWSYHRHVCNGSKEPAGWGDGNSHQWLPEWLVESSKMVGANPEKLGGITPVLDEWWFHTESEMLLGLTMLEDTQQFIKKCLYVLIVICKVGFWLRFIGYMQGPWPLGFCMIWWECNPLKNNEKLHDVLGVVQNAKAIIGGQ